MKHAPPQRKSRRSHAARRRLAAPLTATRPLLAVALLAVGAALGSPAAAHEGDPRVWRISFPAADGARPWVVDEMGLLLGRGGAFAWLCDDALSLSAGLRAALPVSADGRRWLAATREGLYLSADAGCGFERVSGALTGHFVGPLVGHPARPGEVLAGTESLSRPNDVFRTTDGGATWLGAGLALGGRVRSLIRAPEPARVYLSHGAGAARSDDGGQTFTPVSIGPEALGPRADEFRFLAVDPLDPDRVYAALEQFPDGHLLRSEDGGLSWTRLLTVPNDVPESVAIDASGATVWLSAPFSGLWRSNDQGDTWDQRPVPGTLGCLAVHPQDGALWACLRGQPLPWIVARSDDGGETWQPALARYADVTGLGCAPDTPTARICDAQCDPADRTCSTAAGRADAGSSPADAGLDVGPPAERAPRDGAEGCAQRPGGPRGPAPWGLALGLAAIWRRRRHPRAPRDIP